jgi:hypothetical protein
MSFDLQFSLLHQQFYPTKPCASADLTSVNYHTSLKLLCFRLISSPGVYPVLQSSFLHSELRIHKMPIFDFAFCRHDAMDLKLPPQ